jgi:hypothetical protein
MTKDKSNIAGGSPPAITNDLPSAVCWVSQMASSSISHFLLRRQKKVTQEKATPVCRRFAVPCVARLVRLPHKLARSATRTRAQTYSSEFPDQPALLGGAQGMKIKIHRAGTSCPPKQNAKRQVQLSGRLLQGSMGCCVPFAAGRGVKYPTRKLTVVTGNKRPKEDTRPCPSNNS